jgi:MFS family permease
LFLKKARNEATPLPRMAAALLPRERLGWSLNAIALGALEGGLLGVIVKNQFGAAASPALVSLAVAVVAGAPAFANLSSFVFAGLALGRGKALMLSRLMALTGLCLIAMSLPGRSAGGLLLFMLLTIIARVAWTGILTLRAAVWRANFPRHVRGRIAARFERLAALLAALFSALIGFAMDWSGDAWRLLFPVAGCCALGAAAVYRRVPVRRQRALMKAETVGRASTARGLSFAAMAAVLRQNRDFRNYMAGMMVFGGGNLMVVPILVLLLSDHFRLGRLEQVMITASIPVLVTFFSVTFWAARLDKRHIVSYRAIHAWNFVFMIAVFAWAAITQTPALLWLGAVLMGSAHGGGNLGWNLGHHDFSGDADSSLYMATHVSLTGVRGLVMPIAGVVFLRYLESLQTGLGAYALLLPLALTLSGTLWFVHLHRVRRRLGLSP